MTDQEIRQLIDAGVERSEIEYIMEHTEIDEDVQDQLLRVLSTGDWALYESCIQELIENNLWDETKDDCKSFSFEEEARLEEALEYIFSLDELPREIVPQVQYLNLTYVMRHLFYNENEILSALTPQQGNTIKFQTDKGERWEVYYDTASLLTVDKRLDPFDFAVLDVIYTLHANDIFFFSTKWIDMLLSGSSKRNTTKGCFERIERSINKLSYLNIQITINDEPREPSRLLAVQRFGNKNGSYYYLNELNDLYTYATEMRQIANVPAAYFDTSKLPKEYKFSDTETAIYVKRRVIARIMGIIRQSEASYQTRKHWNRISLIHAKERKYINPKGRQKFKSANTTEYPHTKKRGLFEELGLIPDVDGLHPSDQKEIMSKWRKTKADYMRVIRGTLEHLKQIYVILDYEEVRPNESKNLRDPVIGYDIICFTKTEANALKSMRNEKKSAYVQRLLDKKHNE